MFDAPHDKVTEVFGNRPKHGTENIKLQASTLAAFNASDQCGYLPGKANQHLLRKLFRSSCKKIHLSR